MIKRLAFTALFLSLCAASVFCSPPPATSPAASASWPNFRGPDGLCTISADAAKKLPTDFDGPTGKNILWKTELTLPGNSSPVVAGNRVFVSGANADKRSLFCYDGDSGKLLWQKDVTAGGKNPGEPDAEPLPAGYACPTPCTDGQQVAAIYGNGDIAAFDLAGKQLWSQNLGHFEGGYGYASSPLVVGNNIIIQFDHGVQPNDFSSFIIALDFTTGKTVWKTKRANYGAWASPIVVTVNDKKQIIVVSSPMVTAYDADTGKELWNADCIGADPAPSATFANGVVYATVARKALTAIKADGKGDVTKTHILFNNEDDEFPEVPSPVTNGKQVFLVLDNGRVVGFDAAKGKKLWELDRDTDFLSSPTLVGDQLWVFDTKGTLHRIAADGEGKLLGTAALGEKTTAQPAYVGNRIYVRGAKNLYCIGAK